MQSLILHELRQALYVYVEKDETLLSVGIGSFVSKMLLKDVSKRGHERRLFEYLGAFLLLSMHVAMLLIVLCQDHKSSLTGVILPLSLALGALALALTLAVNVATRSAYGMGRNQNWVGGTGGAATSAEQNSSVFHCLVTEGSDATEEQATLVDSQVVWALIKGYICAAASSSTISELAMLDIQRQRGRAVRVKSWLFFWREKVEE